MMDPVRQDCFVWVMGSCGVFFCSWGGWWYIGKWYYYYYLVRGPFGGSLFVAATTDNADFVLLVIRLSGLCCGNGANGI